jgi:DNA-binding MarR family transcriptional regulator
LPGESFSGQTEPVPVAATDADLLTWAGRLRVVIGPLERELRQADVEGFTPTQLAVIGSIKRLGPITLSQLAARERLSAPTISKVVGALEDAGLVVRELDAHDRRVWRVRLTEAGEAFIEEGRQRRSEWLADRLGRLSARERATLLAAVPVLERLLDDRR